MAWMPIYSHNFVNTDGWRAPTVTTVVDIFSLKRLRKIFPALKDSKLSITHVVKKRFCIYDERKAQTAGILLGSGWLLSSRLWRAAEADVTTSLHNDIWSLGHLSTSLTSTNYTAFPLYLWIKIQGLFNRVLTNLATWNSPSFPDPLNSYFQTIIKRKPEVA